MNIQLTDEQKAWVSWQRHLKNNEKSKYYGRRARNSITETEYQEAVRKAERKYQQVIQGFLNDLDCPDGLIYNGKIFLRHGTEAAAARHYRHGEQPCELCRQAHNAYSRQQYAEDKEVLSKVKW